MGLPVLLQATQGWCSGSMSKIHVISLVFFRKKMIIFFSVFIFVLFRRFLLPSNERRRTQIENIVLTCSPSFSLFQCRHCGGKVRKKVFLWRWNHSNHHFLKHKKYENPFFFRDYTIIFSTFWYYEIQAMSCGMRHVTKNIEEESLKKKRFFFLFCKLNLFLKREAADNPQLFCI